MRAKETAQNIAKEKNPTVSEGAKEFVGSGGLVQRAGRGDESEHEDRVRQGRNVRDFGHGCFADVSRGPRLQMKMATTTADCHRPTCRLGNACSTWRARTSRKKARGEYKNRPLSVSIYRLIQLFLKLSTVLSNPDQFGISCIKIRLK